MLLRHIFNAEFDTGFIRRFVTGNKISVFECSYLSVPFSSPDIFQRKYMRTSTKNVTNTS